MVSDIVHLQNATQLSQSGTNAASKELGKEDFLKLLTTQLANQDPLNPMDSKDFVAQLAQFSSLEQLTNLGTKMDSLVEVSAATNSAGAVSLLDKDVRIATNQLNGPEKIYYQIPEKAKSVTLEVRDSTGKVVSTVQGLSGEAKLNEYNLESLAPGEYTFEVHAIGEDGSQLPVPTYIDEHVKGVSFTGSIPILLTDSGMKISASSVVEIRTTSQGEDLQL